MIIHKDSMIIIYIMLLDEIKSLNTLRVRNCPSTSNDVKLNDI